MRAFFPTRGSSYHWLIEQRSYFTVNEYDALQRRAVFRASNRTNGLTNI